MHSQKIQILENEIIEINNHIRDNKKQIKKREKITSMVADEDLKVEILMYEEEIEKLTSELKFRKELVRNYKNL